MVIMLMPEMFTVSTIDGVFIWKMIVITIISWFPFHLFKLIQKKLYPNDYEVIMKGVQQHIIKKI